MINFESPVANSAAPPAEQAVQDHCLLIDSVTATPKSIAKYTMHDLEEFQQEWRRKSEKEFELIQLELAESEAERIKLVEGRKEMESTLAAWDTAMSRMIGFNRFNKQMSARVIAWTTGERLKCSRSRLKS